MAERRVLPQGRAQDAWFVYFLILRLNLLGRRPEGRWAVWFDLVFRHRERCELLQWWQALMAVGGIAAGVISGALSAEFLARFGWPEPDRMAAIPCLSASVLGVSLALSPLLNPRRLAGILDLDLPRSELQRSWLFPSQRDRHGPWGRR